MDDLTDFLIHSYQAGTLVQDVYARSLSEHDEGEALIERLAALHNEGAIDVVAQFSLLKNSADSEVDFFLARHVFEKLLPIINAPVVSVLACVDNLYKEAGNDMAAGIILNSYIAFCSEEQSRPREALTEIEKNNQFTELLAPTLIAGSSLDNERYVQEALRLASRSNTEFKQRAIFALGRFQWGKNAAPLEPIYTALSRTISEEIDDALLASVLATLLNLSQIDDAEIERLEQMIADAVSKGGDLTAHAASEHFGFHTKELPTPILDLLLSFLLEVNPGNKGTIDNIDYGLAHLLRHGDFDKAIEFVEEVLITHRKVLSVDAFDSVMSELRKDPPLVCKIMTRWFLRADSALCEAICTLVGPSYGRNMQLEVDLSELRPPDKVRMIFVARKAIGYLFALPVSAASVIISLMHHTQDDEVLSELASHLFDPLLLSYTGETREYVEGFAAEKTSGKVNAHINATLKSLQDYLDTLRSIGEISELHPSEAQRSAYNRRFSRQMSLSLKKAEEQSVFLNLVTRMVLLYGRRSISYMPSPDSEPTRTEIPLKSHSVEMEFPRADRLDPFGLEYTLRIFRAERIRT